MNLSKKIKILFSFLVCIALVSGLSNGNLLAINYGFSDRKLEVYGSVFYIRPISDLNYKETRYGIPIFQMEDQFFIKVKYKCDYGIRIRKGSFYAGASERFVNGKICYQTFKDNLPMLGSFSILIFNKGKRYEESIDIDRTKFLSFPFWDIMMSA